MDSVILVKLKGENVYLGGDHIGEPKNFYKLVATLLELFAKKGVQISQINQLSAKLYEIDGSNIQDIECVIDKENQTVYFENFMINPISDGNDKLLHIEYKNMEALISKTLSFDEYLDFYNMIKKSLKDGKVIINNQYILEL